MDWMKEFMKKESIAKMERSKKVGNDAKESILNYEKDWIRG